MTEQNEQPQEQTSFSFAKMMNDAKSALLDPKGYFSGMTLTGGFGEPIIKAVIYGTLAGVLRLIWSIAGLSAVGGGLGFLTGNAIGIMALVGSIIGAIIGLFIGAVIILVISSICNGTNDFEANLRVTADMMVLMPINALFGFLIFAPVLNTLISLAINLYGLWMLFHALKGVLKGKPDTAKIITLVLAVLLVLFSLIGFATHRAVRSITRHQDKIIEHYTKAAEEIAREAGGEEAAKAVREAVKESQAVANGEIVLVLEKVDGSKVNNPDAGAVTAALDEMKNEDDFIILSRGDNDYLQAMKSGDKYILQYKDDKGLHEYAGSDGKADYNTIVRLFVVYLAPGPAWGMTRDQYTWKDAEQ
jgi:hypothetical protein